MKNLSDNNPSISVISRTFPRLLIHFFNISNTSETCPAIPRLLEHFRNISGGSETYRTILHHLEYHRNTLSNSETSLTFPKHLEYFRKASDDILSIQHATRSLIIGAKTCASHHTVVWLSSAAVSSSVL